MFYEMLLVNFGKPDKEDYCYLLKCEWIDRESWKTFGSCGLSFCCFCLSGKFNNFKMLWKMRQLI